MIRARVTVTLKNGVLDPQGKAIEGALGTLGFDGVDSVRQGKVFDLEVASADRAKAERGDRRNVREIARQHRDRRLRGRHSLTSELRPNGPQFRKKRPIKGSFQKADTR